MEQVKVNKPSQSEILFSTLIHLIEEANFILDTEISPKIPLEIGVGGWITDLQLTLSELYDEVNTAKSTFEGLYEQ